jgi:hypothetical protein
LRSGAADKRYSLDCMTKIVLPGGTDVAEMAIFSIDGLPSEKAETTSVEAMERARTLIRFPTGADGGYLLHAYVNEAAPAELVRHCELADPIRGELTLQTGRIGFGGVESASASFQSNVNIRSDGVVPPGDYSIVAFQTNFPDELVSAAVRGRIGIRGERLLALPRYIIPFAISLTIVVAIIGGKIAAISAIALTVVGLKFGYFASPTIKRIHMLNDEVNLNFPSIVVEMRSKKSLDTETQLKAAT